MAKAVGALACALFLTVLVACGETGVSAGATVNVYVAAPLCAEAEQELARTDGEAGDVRVDAVCLDPTESKGRLDLATIGANARRATEDSTSVGYLEPPGRPVRFSLPILEGAGIAHLTSESGEAGMSELLEAIAEADTTSLRDSVHDALS